MNKQQRLKHHAHMVQRREARNRGVTFYRGTKPSYVRWQEQESTTSAVLAVIMVVVAGFLMFFI